MELIVLIYNLADQAKSTLDNLLTQVSEHDNSIDFYVQQVNIICKRAHDLSLTEAKGIIYNTVFSSSNHSHISLANKQFEAAKTAIELESLERHTAILAKREQLELQTQKLKDKQRLQQARLDIIYSHGLDERDEIAANLRATQLGSTPVPAARSSRGTPSICSLTSENLTEYIQPSPRPIPRPRFKPQPLPRSSSSKSLPVPNPPATNSQDGVYMLAECLTKALNTQRAPIPEPPVFRGNPLEYPTWKAAFNSYMALINVSNESKLHYLLKYVGNPAAEAITSYALVHDPGAYDTAINTLDERFGSSYTIA
ncbi:hypothetical protein EB796_015202 [Bugula neritina]|uniref:Uncharacterized protein n=1 Tax=Bugula neritina TaxID=10212 RepID=A0A7J7JK90_BUGNE|nr:hypothetical protein EB796_015202 [Bugula neritina]